MELPHGMEPMVFSFVHYRVNDFDSVLSFLKGLEKNGLFVMDELDIKSHKLSGAFVRGYPKGHLSLFSRMLGAKQVIGGAQIKDGHLEIDAKTRSGLSGLRDEIENALGGLIEFEREEFQDVMEMFKKNEAKAKSKTR